MTKSNQVIFGAVAKDYAALGLRVVPTGGPDGKMPLISNWSKVRPTTAVKLADRFRTANMALIDGDPNGVTRIDVDDPDIVKYCTQRFGETPIKVRTPSGGQHLWYRANGERRIIGLENKKIDLLGKGGLGIAPPSIHPQKGAYVFEGGNLDNFHSLPEIRPGSLPADAYLGVRSTPSLTSNADRRIPDHYDLVPDGKRGDWIFHRALRLAHGCASLDELIDLLRMENRFCAPPLSDDKVVKAAKSAWKYQQEDRNWVGQEHRAQIFESEFHRLRQHPEAMSLLVELRLAHACRDGDFALANALADKFGWGVPRFRKARAILAKERFLIRTHQGGKGPRDPPRFKFS
jgi:Bifunctional DNA primase/polymerase, N-terminal/Primase C terminal 1 (PriCT-1)